MIGALLYLRLISLRNLLWTRLKLLRKPQYLLGLLMAGLYFGGVAYGRHSASATSRSPLPPGVAESAGAALLLIVSVLAWVFPSDRAAIAFTEPEVAFLFPAPVTRRTLLHYKLLVSQLGILFSAFLLLLVSGGAADPHRWTRFAGWWLVLTTIRLHALGASFARTLLLDHGFTNTRRRLTVLSVIAGVVALAWSTRGPPVAQLDRGLVELLRSLRGDAPLAFSAPETGFERSLREWLSVWGVFERSWVLVPFRWMVRPFLARGWSEWWRAALPALALIGVHYAWILRADVAFEDASIDLSRRTAERMQALRSGRRLRPAAKKARPLFQLAGRGPVPVGLLWKNQIALLADIRFLFRLLPLLLIGGWFAGRGSEGTAVVAALAWLALFSSFLLGPQVFRADLRGDLDAIDMLKGIPVRGWQIVLGEMLAPVLLLTVFQWSLLAMLNLVDPPHNDSMRALLREASVGLAIVAPALNFLFFVIPNAAALVFPALDSSSRNAGPGLEVVGLRVLTMLGSAVVVCVALVPAGAIGFGTAYVLSLVAPHALVVIVTALVASLVLGVEVAVAIRMLGARFERFDLSTELRGGG